MPLEAPNLARGGQIDFGYPRSEKSFLPASGDFHFLAHWDSPHYCKIARRSHKMQIQLRRQILLHSHKMFYGKYGGVVYTRKRKHATFVAAKVIFPVRITCIMENHHICMCRYNSQRSVQRYSAHGLSVKWCSAHGKWPPQVVATTQNAKKHEIYDIS